MLKVVNDMVCGHYLFQSTEWTGALAKDVRHSPYYGSLLCALLKAVLTEREAAFCFLGPPPGVPKSSWICCMSPCASFKQHCSLNSYVVSMMKMIHANFKGLKADFQAEVDAIRGMNEAFRDVFVDGGLDRRGRSHVYEPVILIPVRQLPQNTIRDLVHSMPMSMREKVLDLFVCPSHFGFADQQATQQSRDLRVFTFHGFRLQLCFQPFGFNFRRTQLNVKVLERLYRSQRKYPDFLCERHETRYGIRQLPKIFEGLDKVKVIQMEENPDKFFLIRGKNKVVTATQAGVVFRSAPQERPHLSIMRPCFLDGQKKLGKEIKERVSFLIERFVIIMNTMSEQGIDLENVSPYKRWEEWLSMIAKGVIKTPEPRRRSSSSSSGSSGSSSSPESSPEPKDRGAARASKRGRSREKSTTPSSREPPPRRKKASSSASSLGDAETERIELGSVASESEEEDQKGSSAAPQPDRCASFFFKPRCPFFVQFL